MREGIAVAERSGVRFVPPPGTPVRVVRLVRYLPAALAGGVAARKAAKPETHWPLKGSTWQGVARSPRPRSTN